MLIATISSQSSTPRIFSTGIPYVWGIVMVYNTTGVYWESIFGAPHEQQLTTIIAEGVTVNDVVYIETETLSECVATIGSWYFDSVAQQFYIHLTHSTDGTTAKIGYGFAIGFSDDEVVSINDTEYLPLIESVPSLSQVQDLVEYDKLATINGEMVLRNVGGVVDYLLGRNIIGGDASLFFLPDSAVSGDGNANGAEIVPLASFFVEDFKPGLELFRVALQDQRLRQDAPFPTERFTVASYPNLDDSSLDLLVPVVYGYQSELKAYPTNGKAASTTVRYRAGLLLTVLTTVYLKVSDKWTTYTPSNIDLATGEFDVAGAKSSATAEPYECKIEATGIPVTYASDVIKDLGSRFGGVGFTGSFYDLSEWASEEVALSTIGIVFRESTTIFDAAKLIQAGANIGFRYEVNASGRRTIRIDDDSRPSRVPGIDNVEIIDADKIEADFDTEFLAAQVRIGYRLSDESGRYLTVIDSSQSGQVIEDYRTHREVAFDTLLTNVTDATERAAIDAIRLATPKKTVSVTLVGKEYLSLRIFDVLTVALTSDPIDLDSGVADGREFLGVQVCKVIGVDPDYRAVTNRVTMQIIRPLTPTYFSLLVAGDGATNIITASGTILRRGGQ